METRRSLFLFGWMLFFVACGTSSKLSKLEPKKVEESNNLERLKTQLLDTTSFRSVSGRAKVLYTSKKQSERFTVEFEANSSQTLMKLKNSLGIEGVHVFLDRDTLTEYNKIERTVIIASKADFGRYISNGYAPFPIMDLLIPARMLSGETEITETETAFEINNEEFLQKVMVPKQSNRIEILTSTADVGSFQEMKFMDYAQVESKQVPRRIQIKGFDSNPYTLLIMITELRVNEIQKVLQIDYPKSIQVERL